MISILFLILHYKDPGFLPFDKIKQNNINNEESQSSKQRDPKPNDQNIFLANKFNVRRLEGSNLSEFNEKIMKKTLDVSIANEENNHQIKNKVEDEDSNEILEVIELNNIADDKNDGDNAILDYKIPKTLKKEDLGSRNIITFGDKKEISIRNLKENDSSFQNEKNNEIESIAIEIRGKNKDIDKNKSFKSITNKDNNSFSISPPEISSSN